MKSQDLGVLRVFPCVRVLAQVIIDQIEREADSDAPAQRQHIAASILRYGFTSPVLRSGSSTSVCEGIILWDEISAAANLSRKSSDVYWNVWHDTSQLGSHQTSSRVHPNFATLDGVPRKPSTIALSVFAKADRPT